jgi:clan AA aspartic protease (TIGR02281 family)
MRRAGRVLAPITSLALFVTVAHFQAQSSDIRELVAAHRWLEARAALTPDSPTIVRAAVANAFGDRATAEPLLQQIVQAQPPSADADAAYSVLAQLYVRTGQYATFERMYRDWSARFADSPGVRAERESFEEFRGRPNQANGPRQRSRLRHDGDFFAPLTVNGTSDSFILDTGAWQSAMTLAEAKRLGFDVNGDVRMAVDASGTATEFRTVVAREVVLGGIPFNDVSFAVVEPEKGTPFDGLELGIIGMPILTHMTGIRWTNDGRLDFGPVAAEGRAAPNLMFDRSRLLLATRVQSRDVRIIIDTGANTTSLNANFADAFPDVLGRGTRSTDALNGLGHSQAYDAWTIPEVSFAIGPTPVTLRPATVTRQTIALLGGECCIGNGGQDLLIQGDGFSIDFARMVLRVF